MASSSNDVVARGLEEMVGLCSDPASEALRSVCQSALVRARAAGAKKGPKSGLRARAMTAGAPSPSRLPRLIAEESTLGRSADALESRSGGGGGDGGGVLSSTSLVDTSSLFGDGSMEPITGLCLVFGSEVAPEGFTKIAESCQAHKKADLNKGSGGRYVYLCVQRGGGNDPITAIAVININRGEFVPPGYAVVKSPSGQSADVNAGSGGEESYLCYRRGAGAPICDIGVLFPDIGETVPTGYTVVAKTPMGRSGDLNVGAGGKEVYLCFQRDLRHLRVLAGTSKGAAASSSASLVMRKSPRKPVGMGGRFSATAAPRAMAAGAMAARARGDSGGAGSVDTSTASDGGTSAALSEPGDLAAEPGGLSVPSPSTGGAAVRPRRESTLEGFAMADWGVGSEIARVDSNRSLGLAAVSEDGDSGATEEDTADPAAAEAAAAVARVRSASQLKGSFGSLSDIPVVDVSSSVGHSGDDDDAWWNAGMTPLQPSRLGNTLWPLLAACYSNDARIVSKSLATLREVLESELANAFPLPGFEEAPTSDERRESILRLVDFVVLVAIDGTDMLLDSVAEPLLGFFSSILSAPGPGQHAVTLHRLFNACLSANVFFNQKKIHLVRCLKWATKHSRSRDIEDFSLVLSDAKRQVVWARDALHGLVSSVVLGVDESPNDSIVLAPAGRVLPPDSSSGADGAAAEAVSELLARVYLSSTMKSVVARYHCHHSLSPGFALEMHTWSRLLLGLEDVGDALRETNDDGHVPPEAVVVHDDVPIEGNNDPAVRAGGAGLDDSGHSDTESEGEVHFPYSSRSRESDAFVLLVILCKLASAPVEVKANGAPRRSADFHVKVLAVQLLSEFFRGAGKRLLQIPALVLAVRRFGVPAVLANFCSHSVVMTLVFKETVGIIPILWDRFRVHLKLEFAVIFGSAVLQILRSPHRSTDQAIDLLRSFETFFQTPQNLVQLYHNYDNETPVEHLRIFAKLFGTLCSLAEGGMSALQDESRSLSELESERTFQDLALSCVCAFLRSLMDASATVHLIPRDERTRRLSLATWDAAEDPGRSPRLAARPTGVTPELEAIGESASPLGADGEPADEATASSITEGAESESRRRRFASGPKSSIRVRRMTQLHNAEVLDKGLQLATDKSLKKAIQYLVATNYIQNTPDSIANFLRIYSDRLDQTAIGDYLSEEGRSDIDKSQFQNLRDAYFGSISFAGLTFGEALRVMLTKAGFRLPGEAQKIDRICTAFAAAYHAANPAVFSSPDTCFVLTFSTIMLNTDAHNPSIKKERKMKVTEFVNNNRGIDDGGDLPRSMLTDLYNDIVNNEIKMSFNPTGETVEEQKPTTPQERTVAFIEEMNLSIARSIAVLNSQAGMWRSYHQQMIPEIVRLMLEDVWTDVLSLVTELSKARDPALVKSALTMLRDVISASLFLGVQEQRRTFAGLLARLVYTLEVDPTLIFAETNRLPADVHLSLRRRAGSVATARTPSQQRQAREAAMEKNFQTGLHLRLPWYDAVVTADRATAVDGIRELHMAVAGAMEALETAEQQDNVIDTARRFTDRLNVRSDLESDSMRRLVYEGRLVKVSRNGTGKRRTYRFFLFSDFLVYASETTFGKKFDAHARVPLREITVEMSPTVLSKEPDSFMIKNSVKNLYLVAPSNAEAAAWRRHIEAAKRDLLYRTSASSRDIGDGSVAGDSGGGELDVAASGATYGGGSGDDGVVTDAADAMTTQTDDVPIVSTPLPAPPVREEPLSVETTPSPETTASESAIRHSVSTGSLSARADIYGAKRFESAGGGEESPIHAAPTRYRVQYSTCPFGFLLRLDQSDTAAVVSQLLEESPSTQAKVPVHLGDVVRGVDGVATRDMSFDAVLELVKQASIRVRGGGTAQVTFERGAVPTPVRRLKPRSLVMDSTPAAAAGGSGDAQTPTANRDELPLVVAGDADGEVGSGESSRSLELPTPRIHLRGLHDSGDAAMATTPTLLSASPNSMRRLSSKNLLAGRRSSRSGANVKKQFSQAVEYARPILSGEVTKTSSGRPVTDDQKLCFYGLFKQATKGDCPRPSTSSEVDKDSESSDSRKRLAWTRYTGLARKEAQQQFVDLLHRVSPGWQLDVL